MYLSQEKLLFSIHHAAVGTFDMALDSFYLIIESKQGLFTVNKNVHDFYVVGTNRRHCLKNM